jgi:hypothetical protein
MSVAQRRSRRRLQWRLDGVSPALRQCRGAIVTITALHV